MVRKRFTCLCLTVAVLLPLFAGSLAVESISAQEDQKFDISVPRLMEKANVNGLAVAFIENGQVSIVKAFGYRNVAKELPLTTDTVMYGASFTKTAFAYMVMQLVGSMDTTINDQSLFWAGLLRGDGLSSNALAEMKRPQLAITSKHQFPTLSEVLSDENKKIQHSTSLGWVTFQDTTGPAWFKGGHNDSTGNIVVCFEKGLRCVILMSNDVRAEKIYPEVVEILIGKSLFPWSWEYEWFSPNL